MTTAAVDSLLAELCIQSIRRTPKSIEIRRPCLELPTEEADTGALAAAANIAAGGGGGPSSAPDGSPPTTGSRGAAHTAGATVFPVPAA